MNEFEAEIRLMLSQDAKNPPPMGGVVFVGSSSIRMWETLAEDFPEHAVINRGFGGSEISDSVYFAKRIVTPYAPRLVVMFAGGNDLSRGKSAETVARDFQEFVQVVREELPEVPIAYISNKPAPAFWSELDEIAKANRLIRSFCEAGPNLTFIDIFPAMLSEDGGPRPDLFVEDLVHLNAAGYAVWRDIVAPYLAKS